MKKIMTIFGVILITAITLGGCGGVTEESMGGKVFTYTEKEYNTTMHICLMGNNKYETYTGGGSSALYLSTREYGRWEVNEDGTIELSGNGLSGNYVYSGGELKNAKFTMHEKD